MLILSRTKLLVGRRTACSCHRRVPLQSCRAMLKLHKGNWTSSPASTRRKNTSSAAKTTVDNRKHVKRIFLDFIINHTVYRSLVYARPALSRNAQRALVKLENSRSMNAWLGGKRRVIQVQKVQGTITEFVAPESQDCRASPSGRTTAVPIRREEIVLARKHGQSLDLIMIGFPSHNDPNNTKE